MTVTVLVDLEVIQRCASSFPSCLFSVALLHLTNLRTELVPYRSKAGELLMMCRPAESDNVQKFTFSVTKLLKNEARNLILLEGDGWG